MKMFFNLNFLKYLISFDFKDFFYLLYSIFYSIFFTKSSFLFGFNVGWNNNFLIIFNMIKTAIVFIWEKLTILIYPLKLFSSLFDFLMQILTIFKDDVFPPIIKFLSQSVDVLIPKDLGPNDGLWEGIKQVGKTSLVAVGGIALRIVGGIEVFQNFRHFLLFKNSLRLTVKLVFFSFQD